MSSALIIGGGGAGIGRAVTRRLAVDGVALAVADLVLDRAAEAAAEVADRGVQAVALSADVRLPGEVDRLVSEAAAGLSGLDILVTVVGGQLAFVPGALLHEITDEDWQLILDLNLTYVARAVRAVLRTFLEQGRGGTIVSIGSIAGGVANAQQAHYGAAKAGLASLARSVAVEYGRHGIRMNVISCGPIATPAARAAQDGAASWIPLGRPGDPAEVADAVAFLASPASAYVSGQVITLDGGATAGGPFPLPT